MHAREGPQSEFAQYERSNTMPSFASRRKPGIGIGVSASQLPSTSGEWSSVMMNSKFGRVSAPIAVPTQKSVANVVKIGVNFIAYSCY